MEIEPETQRGIEKFRALCGQKLQGLELVIPKRPTGANFLISLTYENERTYVTIHEDDFSDWGEGLRLEQMATTVDHCLTKLLKSPQRS